MPDKADVLPRTSVKLLATICDSDVGISATNDTVPSAQFESRLAARVVIVSPHTEIALLDVKKFHYHKLPGGGVEPGENLEQAALREALEETGLIISLRPKQLGKIVEYRSAFKIIQTSVCFLAGVIADTKRANLTLSEAADGCEWRWYSVDNALQLLQSKRTTDYMGRFIEQRDLLFLRAALTCLQ